MTKQEQIDKIAEWMGWHKVSREGGWWAWHDGSGDANLGEKPSMYFDPFHDPADCERVMNEVVKRDFWYKVYSGSPQHNYPSMVLICPWQSDNRVAEGHGQTETEAKMNAVLEMIK